jgi:hypothetical protein
MPLLDGGEVDDYLSNYLKRRDILTSVTMTMLWGYVFTRWLFGLGRRCVLELKALEMELSNSG